MLWKRAIVFTLAGLLLAVIALTQSQNVAEACGRIHAELVGWFDDGVSDVVENSSEYLGATRFEERKQNWLADDGRHWDGNYHYSAFYGMPHLFAWLENNTHQTCSPGEYDCVHNSIDVLLEEVFQSGTASCATLIRLLYGYKQEIENSQHPEDISTINNFFDYHVRKPWLLGEGEIKTQPSKTVARYLYSLEHNDITFTYCPDGEDGLSCMNFSYNGNSYVCGNEYNSYECSRDYMNYVFDHWIDRGNYEFDSKTSYTNLAVEALVALYDFAARPLNRLNGNPDPEGREMKNRAKMMLDLILLDSVLDALPDGQKGSHPGRSYRDKFINGDDGFPWYQYFGLPVNGISRTNVYYVSDYRLSSIISDITTLDDENSDYWYMNYENNGARHLSPDSGKWIYVTKGFNIGGGFAKRWILNINSTDGTTWYTRGKPFSLWINDEAGDADMRACAVYECYNTLGQNGFQYKNSLYTEIPYPILHVAKGDHTFDDGENQLDPYASTACDEGSCENDYELSSGWNYFKEGDTAIAINMGGSTQAIEVALIDSSCNAYHCYHSYEDFKNANRELTSTYFRNGKGDVIGARYDNNLQGSVSTVNGNDVFVFPFDRIETIYGNEEVSEDYMIEWNDRVMVVSYNGQTAAYDFNNWTYTEYGSKPRVPNGLKMTP